MQRAGGNADLLGFLGEIFLILGLDPVARGVRVLVSGVQRLSGEHGDAGVPGCEFQVPSENTVMCLEVAWRLMFRVNDASAAGRCLTRVGELLPAEVVELPKRYWKIPELWEVALRSPFASPIAAGVFELLSVANRLASGWIVSGPLIENYVLNVFEGVFDEKRGRPQVAGLCWASFSVGNFPAAGERTRMI